MENIDNEMIPLSYMLEYAKRQPEFRDAMYIERMLMRYYMENGRGEIAYRLSDEIHDHYVPATRSKKAIITNEQAKEVLTSLINTGIIDMLVQFVGAYRILVDFCGYPTVMTEFCQRIIELRLVWEGKELEYKRLYQGIQKGIQALSILSAPYQEWIEYEKKTGGRATLFTRQKAVADKMIEILREKKILQPT